MIGILWSDIVKLRVGVKTFCHVKSMVKDFATNFNVIESEKNTLFLYKFFRLNLNCMAKIKDRLLHLFLNLSHQSFIPLPSPWVRHFLMKSDICKSFVLGVGKQCLKVQVIY